MKHRQLVVLAALSWGVVTSASDASAQAFERLRDQVKIGTSIAVTDVGGRVTKGVLRGIEPSELVLHVKGLPEERRFPVSSVVRVERPKDSVWNGLFIGMAAGIGGGLLVSTILNTCINCEEFGYVSLALLGGGAGVGAAVDSAIGHRQVLFEAAEGKVALKPVIAPRCAGVALAFSF